ncbi:uncharacterized protein LOC143035127 [Oratosquilla oratoria]|uniref:uncharacterized protein LOC143035127 n=1 Tax=Oratosquilla oratoria TaxID=337810 RepID=UPI003F76D39A
MMAMLRRLLMLVLVTSSAAKGLRASVANDNTIIESYSRQPSSVVIENLHRGHDSLIVKLREVHDSLKDDELKLNNVFYKLGLHDTELKGLSSSARHMTSSTRRIEAKLNKHAFNVDFLRRNFKALEDRVEQEGKASDEEMNNLEVKTVRLEERLAEVLSRLSSLENSTESLKREMRHGLGSQAKLVESGPLVYYASQASPKSIFPADQGVCASGWTRVGHLCYWIGREEVSYTEAVAQCTSKGGILLSLEHQQDTRDYDDHFKALKDHLRKESEHGFMFFTSATDIFTPGKWSFLITGDSLPHKLWAKGVSSHSSNDSRHCGVISNFGFLDVQCSQKYPAICQV